MMIELNRDDLINLLKLALARVNELEEIISKDEGCDMNPKFKHSPYPPNWPYGEESKKRLKDEFDYEHNPMVDHGDYEP